MIVPYKAVVFDLFGTLVDTVERRDMDRCLAKMADCLGIPADAFNQAWVEAYPHRNSGVDADIRAHIEHICHGLGAVVGLEQIAAASQIRIAFTHEVLVPRRGAVETLSRLKEIGLRTALISDCSPEVPPLWVETPFASLVDVAIFSCVIGITKPDPRVYQLAGERLGVPLHECLYVGDGTSEELTGASRVGMCPTLIRASSIDPRPIYRNESLAWQGPRIDHLGEVLRLVGL